MESESTQGVGLAAPLDAEAAGHGMASPRPPADSSKNKAKGGCTLDLPNSNTSVKQYTSPHPIPPHSRPKPTYLPCYSATCHPAQRRRIGSTSPIPARPARQHLLAETPWSESGSAAAAPKNGGRTARAAGRRLPHPTRSASLPSHFKASRKQQIGRREPIPTGLHHSHGSFGPFV